MPGNMTSMPYKIVQTSTATKMHELKNVEGDLLREVVLILCATGDLRELMLRPDRIGPNQI